MRCVHLVMGSPPKGEITTHLEGMVTDISTSKVRNRLCKDPRTIESHVALS